MSSNILSLEPMLEILNLEILKSEHIVESILLMESNLDPALVPYVICITSMRGAILQVAEMLSETCANLEEDSL